MIKLNLGCGDKKIDGYVNIDMRPECCPDEVCNIGAMGLRYPDSSVDEVRAFDFLEHIEMIDCVFVIREIYRVLRHGGRFEHFTPSTDGRGAFMDLTHRSFWNINTWLYFTHEVWRALYGYKMNFRVIELRDIITDNALRIIHTYGVFEAVK